MTVKEAVEQINLAMRELQSVNISNYQIEDNQKKVNKAYDILYELRVKIRKKE